MTAVNKCKFLVKSSQLKIGSSVARSGYSLLFVDSLSVCVCVCVLCISVAEWCALCGSRL